MTEFTRSMSADQWRIDRPDLAGYLERLGVAVREPSRAALDRPLEAHVRTFTFEHPGVDLDAVQDRFVGRGRRPGCFSS